MVENLYAGLSKANQEHLSFLLFGNKHEELSAFLRSNDIGLSKLEILADYFRMPMESLRMDTKFDMMNVRENNMVGNVVFQEDESLAMEREALKQKIEDLRNQINAKTAELEAKDKKIAELKGQQAALQQ